MTMIGNAYSCKHEERWSYCRVIYHYL